MKEWSLEENIKAILECNFSTARDEIIESATKRIMEQISSQNLHLEDIKVEIQNTILLQTYQRAQINILEKIKPEILKEMEKLKGNSGCDYFANCTIDKCIGTASGILDKYIEEIE